MNRTALIAKQAAQTKAINTTKQEIAHYSAMPESAPRNTMLHNLSIKLKRQQAALEVTSWALEQTPAAQGDPTQLDITTDTTKTKTVAPDLLPRRGRN